MRKYLKALVESVENIEMWCKVEDDGYVFIGKNNIYFFLYFKQRLVIFVNFY